MSEEKERVWVGLLQRLPYHSSGIAKSLVSREAKPTKIFYRREPCEGCGNLEFLFVMDSHNKLKENSHLPGTKESFALPRLRDCPNGSSTADSLGHQVHQLPFVLGSSLCLCQLPD